MTAGGERGESAPRDWPGGSDGWWVRVVFLSLGDSEKLVQGRLWSPYGQIDPLDGWLSFVGTATVCDKHPRGPISWRGAPIVARERTHGARIAHRTSTAPARLTRARSVHSPEQPSPFFHSNDVRPGFHRGRGPRPAQGVQVRPDERHGRRRHAQGGLHHRYHRSGRLLPRRAPPREGCVPVPRGLGSPRPTPARVSARSIARVERSDFTTRGLSLATTTKSLDRARDATATSTASDAPMPRSSARSRRLHRPRHQAPLLLVQPPPPRAHHGRGCVCPPLSPYGTAIGATDAAPRPLPIGRSTRARSRRAPRAPSAPTPDESRARLRSRIPRRARALAPASISRPSSDRAPPPRPPPRAPPAAPFLPPKRTFFHRRLPQPRTFTSTTVT